MAYSAFLPAEAIVRADLSTFGPTLANLAALPGSGLFRAMAVSGVTTGVVVVSQLALGLGAAYAVRRGLGLLGPVLILLAVPSELLLVPLYRLLATLRLVDTPWALVAPFVASPMVIFLLVAALRRVPDEVLEAAELDGADHGVTLTRIVAPIVRPELLATGVLAFAAHWNLVLFPRVVTTEAWWTVQAFLTELLRTRSFEWGLLGAASLVASVPVLVLYVVFEKRIIATFEASFES
jgi:multiple sugar transport system permease protein